MKINSISINPYKFNKNQIKTKKIPRKQIKSTADIPFGAFDINKVHIIKNNKTQIEPYKFDIKISDEEIYTISLLEASTKKYLYDKDKKLNPEQIDFFVQTVGLLMQKRKETKKENIKAVNDFLDLTHLAQENEEGVLKFSDFATRQILKQGLENSIIDNSDKLNDNEVEEIIGIVEAAFDFIKKDGYFDFKNFQNGLFLAYNFYELCENMNIDFISMRATALKETILEYSKDKNGNVEQLQATLLIELLTSLSRRNDEEFVKSANEIIKHFKNNNEQYAKMINFANEFNYEKFKEGFIRVFDSENKTD